MKTNLIEVTVSGRTGSGKSEVLEVIKGALQEFYSYPMNTIKIAGIDVSGSIEEAKVTGQTAKKGNTIFVLFEQNISGEISVHN
jgi:energy-coupling factor transporter ATP-binding protein EcfA2